MAWKRNGIFLRKLISKEVNKEGRKKTIYIAPESTNEPGRITAT